MVTLPRGPVESTQSWYASARLGVYCCTLICWGCGVGAPRVHFFLGRCKEKSAPYSMGIFEYYLKNLVCWDDVEQLQFWSDGGRHFRASVPISTMGLRGLQHLCLKSKAVCPHSVSLNFGLASHFKNHVMASKLRSKSYLQQRQRNRPSPQCRRW